MNSEGPDRKRILIIVQNLPVAVDRRVWLECQALVNAGYGVTVICPKGPREPRYREQDGVIIRSYRPAPSAAGPLGYAYEFLYCWLRTALLSLVVLVREGFDTIQACNPPDTFWALALPYKLLGKTFVYDQHDLCPEVFRARFACEDGTLLKALLFLERCTYRTADRVMSTNESYRRNAIERGHVDPARVSVVRSGPDPDLMRRGEARPELRRGRAHLCCYLGVMGPQDGVDTLVRSIDVFVNEHGRTDTTFALLGFGDCVPALKRQTSELGLDDYVVFTGRADSRMIEDYLSTADIGLSSDPMNPLNDVSTMNKTLEYMAYSLPVLAYDLVETRVSAGDAGVYLEPGDERGYARCLAELLDDPPRRALLGERGRRRIEQSLSWRYSEAVYVGVYDQMFGVVREPVTVAAEQVIWLDIPAQVAVPAQATPRVSSSTQRQPEVLGAVGSFDVRDVPAIASGE
jgi:glycosyltransferase involved in cell wall biosynthesis